MSTRAIQFVIQQKVPHEVITYDHQEKGAVFAAKATAFPLEQTIKTLVVEMGDKEYALALLPGNRQLSLKKLAKVLAIKKVSMAEEKDAEKVTGYLVGGISPFGTRRSLPVIMEADLLSFHQVLINAGQRGIMLKMDPAVIAQTLNCTIAGISDSISGKTRS
jgi:Cys-tRNA(Pro)/Cys-tRNA(Cys) deacylase